MRWVLKVLVGVLIVVIMGSSSVFAAGSTGWEGQPYIVSRAQSDNTRRLPFYCGGDVAEIQIAGEVAIQSACVFGIRGAFRMAQYLNNQGKLMLLASYATDRQFYIVRDISCGYENSCVYSQSSDILLRKNILSTYSSELGAYDDVSQMLRLHFDPAIMNHYFTLDTQIRSVNQGLSTSFPVGRLAVSGGGRWAVVEYQGKGVVRLDMHTAEQRRVATLFARDWNNFAITEDGDTIAVGNERSGSRIISIDRSCGDRVTEGMDAGFPAYVRTCPEVYPDVYGDFARFFSAERPYFFDDDRLYFYITTFDGQLDVIYSPTEALAEHASVRYVALGDSFTSGEGETDSLHYFSGTDQFPHTCHVGGRSYPYLLSQIPLIGALHQQDVFSAACSGATMKDVVGERGEYMGQGGRISQLDTSAQQALRETVFSKGVRGIVPQIDFVKNYHPELVTVGIGGNDAGFMGKLKSCIAPCVCEWARPGSVRHAVAQEIDALYEKFKEMLVQIKRATTGVVIAIGYPQIISENKTFSCGAILDILLSYEERIFMNRSITRLNNVIERAARDVAVEYIAVESAYEGHKLCEPTSTPAMNGIRLGDDFGPIEAFNRLRLFGSESFHPTPFGHQFVAKQIMQHYGSPNLLSRMTFVDDIYWDEGVGEGDALRYMLLTPEINEYSKSDSYKVAVKDGTFAPNSSLSIRFQGSDRKHEVAANAAGGFTGVTPLSITTPGVYAVYIKGVTSSGEHIEAYEMIAYHDKKSNATNTVGVSVAVADEDLGAVAGLSEKMPLNAPTLASAIPSLKITAGEGVMPAPLTQKKMRSAASVLVVMSGIGFGVVVVLVTIMTILIRRSKKYSKEV